MADMNETAKAIESLAGKLDRNEVSALDLVIAIRQKLKVVSGQPHFAKDAQTVAALGKLAGSAAKAFDRQWQKLTLDTLRELGAGVAAGTLGKEFFDGIKPYF